MLPLLVVTRPQPDATLWAQQLQAAGVPSHCLPLMEIGPSRSPAAQAALACALQQLDTYSALMFVSGNAVRYFADQLQTTHRVWPAQARIWTPGPGTTKALLAVGVPLAQIDQPAADAAQFDSESLWAQIQTQVRTGQRVLIVRGGDGQDAAGRGRVWLTEQLQRQGGQVDFAPVYERHPPADGAALLQDIAALRAQNAVWLFSSSECVQHLRRSNPAWSWQAHTALATHPRIAQQARDAGFGTVIDTPPTVQGIVASIKSLHDLP